MQRYWVVGGEYRSTDFEEIAEGKEEERYGPYASLKEARQIWAALAQKTVDNALVRYRIEREGGDEYWVVGGEYNSTDFREIAEGSKEERYGPYKSREEAYKKWRERAWARAWPWPSGRAR